MKVIVHTDETTYTYEGKCIAEPLPNGVLAVSEFVPTVQTSENEAGFRKDYLAFFNKDQWNKVLCE